MRTLSRSLTHTLILAPALTFYVWLARSLWFVQDDAYISYRFVANYLNGHGLVYNVGERIEGFTNFGWVILMALFGHGGDLFIPLSQWLGLLCGGGVIVTTYLLARQALGRSSLVWPALAAYLMAANQSLAYWSPAGLETAAFALMSMLSLWLYLRRSRLLIWTILMAVWLRPEGALMVGLLILMELIQTRSLPRFSLTCGAIALVASLPFVAFKTAYFGSILPNPFFAKTGLHWDQLSSGIEYAGRFWWHYGFAGLGVVGGGLLYRRWPEGMRTVWLMVVVYSIYIVVVGGDVLKVHRFFLPIAGLVALLSVAVLQTVLSWVPRSARYLALTLVAVVMLGLTFQLPRDFVLRYNNLERKFVQRMQWLAGRIKAYDESDFAVALPTIGIFGYELLGHDIIDMVGLTDSTIARHSEEPIEGMATTWKERSHNTKYLLTRAPEYIVFSTGIKPSAPAERALCLYKPFLDSYRTVGWYYDGGDPSRKGTLTPVFKLVRPIEGDLVPTYPVAYVQYYKEGLDHYVKGDFDAAVRSYDLAMAASPQPYNPYLVQQKAFALMLGQRHEEAIHLLDSLIEKDSLVFEAHKDRYLYAVLLDDSLKASIHQRWLEQLVPDYWPRIRQEALRLSETARQMEQRSQPPPGS
ncbi:MAG: hypothetical protein ABIE70_12765 [bacterium]